MLDFSSLASLLENLFAFAVIFCPIVSFQIYSFHIFHFLELLLSFSQASLLFFFSEWILSVLFLFHNGWFKGVLFRFGPPSCNHSATLSIMNHASFLSFLDVFFFGESLPFCQNFFFRQLESSWELNPAFWKVKIKLSLGKIMNLLFFGERVNKCDLIFFGFDGFEKDELNIFKHGIEDIAFSLFVCLTHRHSIRVVESHSPEVDLSVGLLHVRKGNYILVMLIYRLIIIMGKSNDYICCLFGFVYFKR
jgi:hypothetical protein